jgi:hypothetical protein
LKELGADIGQIGLFFTLSQIIPLSHQQSRTSAIARGGFWLAEHQPGIGFLARADDWGLFMGKGLPPVPIHSDSDSLFAMYCPCLFQVQNHG